MENNKLIIDYLENKLFELEEQWNNWPLDLSLPKQILEIKEEINRLLTTNK